MKKIFIYILALSTISLAQETPQTGMGISASYQSSQLSIVLPFWFGEFITIAPSFGFVSIEESGQDYQIGIQLKNYLYKEKASPFIGISVASAIYSPESKNSVTDMVIGISAGGEYFVDKNFSFGIEGQLNGINSDDKSARFGAAGKFIVNTATVIYATIYFN